MILDSTMKLEFSCDAGTDVEFHASARNSQGNSRYDLATSGVSASTAAVEIVGAPPSGETREVLGVQIRNSGASTRVATVRVDVSGTDREVRVVSLLTHESLDYSPAGGWIHYGADGNAIVTGVAISQTISGTLDVTGAVTTGALDVTGAIAATTSVTAADLVATDDCIVGDDLNVTGLATIGETLAVTGDITAAGGFRRNIGPFTAPGAAGVTAAAQTNLDLRYSHTVTAIASGWVAPRAGSIVGLSAQISEAVTGSGQSIAVKVTKNGTEVGAALDLAFTQAAAETVDYSVAAKDTVTFVAGDIVGISYTSNTITNTPALVASVEVEC